MGIDQLDGQVQGLEIPENPYQASVGQLIHHLIMQQPGNAQALHAGLACGSNLIADQSRSDFLGLLLVSVPVVPVPPLRGERDARVLPQRAGAVDSRGRAKIIRTRAGDEPGGADLARHQSRVGQMADAQCEVETLIEQGKQLVVQAQLDPQLPMFREKGVHERRDVALPELHGRGHAQQATNDAVARLQPLFHVIEVGEHAPAPGQVLRSFVGQCHAPGAAVQQAHAQVALQRRQRANQRRHGLPRRIGRRAQAAVVDDPHEIGHCLEPVHCHPSICAITA